MNNLRNVVALRIPHYLVAGVITLVVEYNIFLIGFYVLHLSGIIANTLSFVFSLTVNYLLNRIWVFKVKTKLSNSKKQTFLYVALAVTNLSITNIGLHFLLALSLPAFAVKLTFVVMIATWNFLLFRRLIFNNKDPLV